MRRRTAAFVLMSLIALILAAAVIALALGASPSARRLPPPDASLPSIERVRELAELVTLRVEVTEFCEATAVEGYLGGLHVAVYVRGDVDVGTDLARARLERQDPAARTAVLVLAPPRASPPRVDHARSRVVAVDSSGAWAFVPQDAEARGRAVERAYAVAERAIAEAGADVAMVERGKRRAEQVVTSSFAAAGWKVTVKWNGE